MKRYNMIIPTVLYDEVERVANEKNVTVIEMMRNFIKFGLLINKLNNEGAEIIIRKGDEEKQVLLTW